MNIHTKEWIGIAIACSEKQAPGLQSAIQLASRKIPPAWRETTQKNSPSLVRILHIQSKFRYFQYRGDQDEILEYFEGGPSPLITISSSGIEKISYPCYAATTSIDDESITLLLFPYVRLAVEFLSQLSKKTSLTYSTANVARLLEIMESQAIAENDQTRTDEKKEDFDRLRLRQGRIPLTVNLKKGSGSSVRNMTLAGDDVLSSQFLRDLRTSKIADIQFSFASTVVRVCFTPKGGRSLVVKVDVRGNFALHPGVRGGNLLQLLEFYRFIRANAAAAITENIPCERIVEL